MKSVLLLLLAPIIVLQDFATANELTREEKTSLYLKEIYRQVEKLERFNRTKHRHAAAFTIGSDGQLNRGIPVANQLLRINNKIKKLSNNFDRLRRFTMEGFENYSLVSLAEEQVEKQPLEVLHLKLFGSEDLIGQLASGNQMFKDLTCRTPQSPQQYLFSLYTQYVLLELKAHALIEWSWLLLMNFGLCESVEEKNRTRGAYKRRTPSTLSKIKELMSQADPTVWRCDPTKHEVGVTYEEVTRLLQGYIENEVDLNSDGSCGRDCSYYKSTKSEGCFDNKFCSEQPKCSGGVYDCRFVESDMKVCQAAKNSSRRYEFIQYESGLVHGKEGSCNKRLHNANSWNRWIIQECSYCLCLCDDQGIHSDRYFNLRPVFADVDRNRVVTGLRFVKRNRVFHLQIQEGELLPLGVINESTLQWKPVDEYSVTDKDVQEGIDFHRLTYEKRSVDLDELKADDNSVVTGLRFKVRGTHLQLEAQFSRVDFQSGLLIDPKTKSYWRSACNDQQRNKLPLKDAQVSTRSSTASIPYSSDNHFIEFTNTGFEQDAGQSTVPFIDMQDVVSEPAVPLSGIGLYYKGQDGFGGFLAPKLITYDFTPHVQLPSWESMQPIDE